ncbi:MAG TPA: TetR/AcrR family transcriptional regulator [Planctomycetota bacterium]
MAKRGRPKVLGLPERRREQILAAATSQFARRGYDGTDLQVVADRMRAGKGTVYRYFPTKEALFFAAADRGMRLLVEATNRDAAAARSPLDRIVRATGAYLRFYHDRPEFVELLVQERAEFRDRPRPTYFLHRDANIAPWHDLLRSLMRDGLIRRMPAERITDVFNAALYGAIFTNYFEGRRRPPARQAREILDVLFRGILAPRGRVHKTRGGRQP